MKNYFALPALLALFLFSGLRLPAQDLKNYTVRTYQYIGNSFAEKSYSKIDSAHFAWESQYKGGKMTRKFFPKYLNVYERTEVYQYGPSGKLEKMIATTTNRYSKEVEVDSTIYQYKKKPGDYDMVETVYSKTPWEHRYTYVKDTTFIEEYSAGKFSNTMKEVKISDKIKETRVIKPQASNLVNTIYYDSCGNEMRYERSDNGRKQDTRKFEYDYDECERMIQKRTYLEPGHQLMSVEINIYK